MNIWNSLISLFYLSIWFLFLIYDLTFNHRIVFYIASLMSPSFSFHYNNICIFSFFQASQTVFYAQHFCSIDRNRSYLLSPVQVLHALLLPHDDTGILHSESVNQWSSPHSPLCHPAFLQLPHRFFYVLQGYGKLQSVRSIYRIRFPRFHPDNRLLPIMF